MISHVKFVSIPTTNQDRSLAFYTGQLGFTLVTGQVFGPTQRWIEVKIAGSPTILNDPDGNTFVLSSST